MCSIWHLRARKTTREFPPPWGARAPNGLAPFAYTSMAIDKFMSLPLLDRLSATTLQHIRVHIGVSNSNKATKF
jgi:hypothetical protein